MSDSMKQALTEGISFESDSNVTQEDAKTEASSPSTPTEQATPQATSPANTPATPEDNLPFHKHPKFTEAIKANRETQRRYAELERQFKEQQAFLKGFQQGQPQQTHQIPDDQRQALLQLAKLMKESPEFQKELGLDRISHLEQSSQEVMMSRTEDAYNKELGELLTYAEGLGLDRGEVEDRMNEMLSSPVYGERSYTPGIVKSMFRDAYWDKMGEIKEREANSRLIKEQEAKRKAQTETTSSGSAAPGKGPLPKGMETYLKERIKSAGGISV